MNLYGPDFPIEGIRQRAWCTICGQFGAYTHVPSHRNMQVGDEPYIEEKSYHAHLRRLDEAGKRTYVVYDAETRAIRRDGLTIAQALEWSARANDVQINASGRFQDYAVTIVRNFEVLWSHPCPMGSLDDEERRRRVYATLIRENGMVGRYRPASFEQYRLAVAARNAR